MQRRHGHSHTSTPGSPQHDYKRYKVGREERAAPGQEKGRQHHVARGEETFLTPENKGERTKAHMVLKAAWGGPT
jgi:hypothetical protein